MGATLVPPALEEEIEEVEIQNGDVAIASTSEIATEVVDSEAEE